MLAEPRRGHQIGDEDASETGQNLAAKLLGVTLLARPGAHGLVLLSARLTTSVTGKGLGGQTIVFKIGSATLCTAVTGANGAASCVALLTLSEFIEANTYTASYAGSPPYLKSTATGSFYLGTPFFGLG